MMSFCTSGIFACESSSNVGKIDPKFYPYFIAFKYFLFDPNQNPDFRRVMSDHTTVLLTAVAESPPSKMSAGRRRFEAL